jgi:hypothetical protein
MGALSWVRVDGTKKPVGWSLRKMRMRRRRQYHLKMSRLSLLIFAGLLACAAPRPEDAALSQGFATRSAALSEPGGFFDTDNLISNERSYLHAVDDIEALGIHGGAYLGVGPDQNFSYIAAIEPEVAYLIDIRRDNLLLHLLYKALFELAATRVEYLALLFGREPPAAVEAWRDADITALVRYLDEANSTAAIVARTRVATDSSIATFGVLLDSTDWATIDRFHQTFIRSGLSLTFQTFGRPPRAFYPTYRDLLAERDRGGRQVNYLASPHRYEVVRELQLRDAVIPVVGDVAGSHALSAIAEEMQAGGIELSVFYISNVEFYLFREGTFDAFAANLERLPRLRESVIVRSVFDRGGPEGFTSRDGVVYYSRQQVRSTGDLLNAHAAGSLRTYSALVGR